MILSGVVEAMENAQKNALGDAFENAGKVLNDNKNRIREEIQKNTANEVKSIIAKLHKKQPLTTEDMETVELWIIGDAESYTKMENNYNDWLKEFTRLKDVLKSYEQRECSATDLFRLQGLLEDAIRVSYDIAHFLEDKERIDRFKNSLMVRSYLDESDRKVLANMLTSKLQSPDM